MSIPITLVTGFLGAGKSTLINKVLGENPGLKFGLVVNEFGDVKLESQIIESEGEAITELSNGCMCCVVRSDLVSTVDGLLTKAPKLNHIIMEASGLSDPVPIANTFLNDDLGGKVHFDAILCVIDTTNFRESLKAYPVSKVQLEYSDFILLSKTDLAAPEEVDGTRRLIRSINPQARILELGVDFPANLVFDTSQVDHSELAGLRIEEHHHHHDEEGEEGEGHEDGHGGGHEGPSYHHAHESVDTLFYTSEKPFDLDRLGLFLKELPQEVVRAKGFLYFAERKARKQKYILQMVGSRPVLDAKPWAKGEKPQSALVFIGRGFDRERLEAGLRACEATRV